MIQITKDNSMLAFTTLKAALEGLSIKEDLLYIQDPLEVDFPVDSYEYCQIGDQARASLVQAFTYTRWGLNYCIDAPNKPKISGWTLYKYKPRSVSITYIAFLDAFAVTVDDAEGKFETMLVTYNERSQKFCKMWNEISSDARAKDVGYIWFDGNQAKIFRYEDHKVYRIKLLEPITENKVDLWYVEDDPENPHEVVFEKTSNYLTEVKTGWFSKSQPVLLFNLLKE